MVFIVRLIVDSYQIVLNHHRDNYGRFLENEKGVGLHSFPRNIDLMGCVDGGWVMKDGSNR
jgi:hypothetical protein